MTPAKNQQPDCKLTPELYDLYAPVVYNKVLSIVRKEPIAKKVFEKVFTLAYTNNNVFPVRSPLLSLIDLAHKKSCKTIEALTIFSACCSGTTVSIANKK